VHAQGYPFAFSFSFRIIFFAFLLLGSLLNLKTWVLTCWCSLVDAGTILAFLILILISKVRLLKGAELAAGDAVTVSRLACSVSAKVLSRVKSLLCVSLDSPLPLDDADISVCLSRAGKLIAVGTFLSGLELPPLAPFDPQQKKKKSSAKKKTSAVKENAAAAAAAAEAPITIPGYAEMAQSFHTLEKTNFREKLTIPPPAMGKTKTKLLVSNFKKICAAMNRPIEHVKV
jgi:hypothetical protein